MRIITEIIIQQDIRRFCSKITNVINNNTQIKREKDEIMIIYILLFLLTILIPIVLHLKYGRDEELKTEIISQRELPSHDHPVIINGIFRQNYGNNIGDPNLNGFKAGMYELVRKGFLEFDENEKHVVLDLNLKRFSFRINHEYYKLHKSELFDFEIKMMEIFEKISENDIVHFEDINKDDFMLLFESWQASVRDYLKETDEVKKYHNSNGEKMAFIYCLVCLNLNSVLFVLYSVFGITIGYEFSLTTFLIIFGFQLYFMALTFVLLLYRTKLFDKWTAYGVECRERWRKFGEHLQDSTIIDEYSPKYMKIWDDLWVYSVVLEVNKSAPPKSFWQN